MTVNLKHKIQSCFRFSFPKLAEDAIMMMLMLQFEVELQFMHDSLCYVTSGIMVRHMPSRKEKMVWHLQYTDWPDHACPQDTYGFLGVCSFVYHLSMKNYYPSVCMVANC